MNIICLQSDKENRLIENEVSNFYENYFCQEIFYPLWFLEVEVCMYFFSSRIKKTSMKVGIDGLSGDVSFVCNELETYEVDVKPEQILPLTSTMDEEGSAKVKASLLPYILPRARSIFVRPSINILSCKIIYKHLYRLSTKDKGGEIIFVDKSNNKIAIFERGGK